MISCHSIVTHPVVVQEEINLRRRNGQLSRAIDRHLGATSINAARNLQLRLSNLNFCNEQTKRELVDVWLIVKPNINSLIVAHLPVTEILVESEAVMNLGASAETSHSKLPLKFFRTFCMVSLFAFEPSN